MAHPTRQAAEPIPYGSPVRADATLCWISCDLTDMFGVARRGGASEHGYVAGEDVTIQTEGGIKVALAADVTLTIAGVQRRLLAREANYLELRGGRIVG